MILFMKPPICSVCDIDFYKNGGLVYFKETEEDTINNTRLQKKGMVGHPTNAFWFCEKHYAYAKKLSDLTKTEAFELIRKQFESDKY